MTAKEKLRAAIEDLSEAEAAEALALIVHRGEGPQRDAMTEFVDNAPLDDEPTTPEEEAGVREAREQIARGEVISADEIRREFA